METNGKRIEAALETAALVLAEGFEPEGGPYPANKLRAFASTGTTLRAFHDALVAGTARALNGAGVADIASAYGDTEFRQLVGDVSLALRFHYEEGDPADADEILAALSESAKAGRTFDDLANALPAAVERLSARFPADEEVELTEEDREQLEGMIDALRGNPDLRAALGFTEPRPR